MQINNSNSAHDILYAFKLKKEYILEMTLYLFFSFTRIRRQRLSQNLKCFVRPQQRKFFNKGGLLKTVTHKNCMHSFFCEEDISIEKVKSSGN